LKAFLLWNLLQVLLFVVGVFQMFIGSLAASSKVRALHQVQETKEKHEAHNGKKRLLAKQNYTSICEVCSLVRANCITVVRDWGFINQ
jgi:hypothetical protein